MGFDASADSNTTRLGGEVEENTADIHEHVFLPDSGALYPCYQRSREGSAKHILFLSASLAQRPG